MTLFTFWKKQLRHTNAWDAGCVAALDGFTPHVSPHVRKSKSHLAWLMGWREGYKLRKSKMASDVQKTITLAIREYLAEHAGEDFDQWHAEEIRQRIPGYNIHPVLHLGQWLIEWGDARQVVNHEGGSLVISTLEEPGIDLYFFDKQNSVYMK